MKLKEAELIIDTLENFDLDDEGVGIVESYFGRGFREETTGVRINNLMQLALMGWLAASSGEITREEVQGWSIDNMGMGYIIY